MAIEKVAALKSRIASRQLDLTTLAKSPIWVKI
jgi:hypothetical protein